jgi:hypothetical protein
MTEYVGPGGMPKCIDLYGHNDESEKAILRRKNCDNLIEYIQKERVIHVLTKILYSTSLTPSQQILIEKFSEAWIKYKARNAEDRTT